MSTEAARSFQCTNSEFSLTLFILAVAMPAGWTARPGYYLLFIISHGTALCGTKSSPTGSFFSLLRRLIYRQFIFSRASVHATARSVQLITGAWSLTQLTTQLFFTPARPTHGPFRPVHINSGTPTVLWIYITRRARSFHLRRNAFSSSAVQCLFQYWIRNTV